MMEIHFVIVKKEKGSRNINTELRNTTVYTTGSIIRTFGY